MSTIDKLIDRLIKGNAVITKRELHTLLTGLGYDAIQGSGSRIKYINRKTGQIIQFHTPHGTKDIPLYVQKQVINKLTEAGLI